MAKKKSLEGQKIKQKHKQKDRKKREKVELEGQLIRYYIILTRVPGRDYKNKNKSIIKQKFTKKKEKKRDYREK